MNGQRWRITSTVSELKRGNRRRGDIVLLGDLEEMTWRFSSAPFGDGRATDSDGAWCDGAS
jgi:hypothetical protein